MEIRIYCRHYTQHNDVFFSARDLCRGLQIKDHLFAVMGNPGLGDFGLPSFCKVLFQPDGIPHKELFVNAYGAFLLADGRTKSPEATMFAAGILTNLIPETIRKAGLEDHFTATRYFDSMAERAAKEVAQQELDQQSAWIAEA